MRTRFTLLLLFAALLGATSRLFAQDSITLDVFSGGLGTYNVTSDGQYMVTTRIEASAIEGGPSTKFIDVIRTSDFNRISSYDIEDQSAEFIAISPDAQLIAFVDQGGLYILDRQTGAITQKTANFYEFEALEFNPVNNLLAYVIGGIVTVIDPAISAIQYDLNDEVYGGRISSVAWSPDGRYLAHGVYRGGETGHDVVVWEMTELTPGISTQPSFALLGGEPSHVAWRDANTLASFGSGGVSIFDVPTRSLITFIPNPPGQYWSDGAWSPDGTQLIASGGNETAAVIQMWNVGNLPDYENLVYQEGVSGSDIHWTPSDLLYFSRGGLRRDGEFLAPQLTATAQATASFVPSSTASQPPTATATPLFTASFTPMPTSTPTATLPPTAINAQVAITRIIDAGNITAEGAEIRNNGPVIDLSGWTLRDAEGNAYIFPNGLQLYQGGSLTVFTRVGDDTPIALYWDRQQAAYTSGEAVTLADREGRAQSIATVP